MLQLSYIREKRDELLERYKKRNLDASEIIDKIIDLDEQRRSTQKVVEDQHAKSNQIAKQIGELFKSGNAEQANELKASSHALKAKSQELSEQLSSIKSQQQDLLYQLPNVPNHAVPTGTSETDNQIIGEYGEKIKFDFTPLSHWDIAKKHGLIDFELGVKITGAGFPVYLGKGAKLQRGLINFFLSEAEVAGYEELIPPHVVNEASGIGTGQLPDKEGQMYHLEIDDLYLIPTAEVPITNMYRDVILKEDSFPIKNCAYSPCFRREAGSYGKDVRGLNRLHQFDKVEIVQVQHPNDSYRALDEMVQHVKSLLDKLELQYRIVLLCGGDLGFTSAITYDFEVYSAAQEKWLEVSSVSNFEAFQANRLKLRFKNKEGKSELAHTLNGSALALPRILAAILENNQTKEGDIKIPQALIPFVNFSKIG